MHPPIPPHRPSSAGKLTEATYLAMNWIGSVQSLIVHTLFFAGSFSLILFGFEPASVLLVVTTIVSLEAIYMAIFIQMAVNRNTQSLDAVEEDIDEIQEDVDEIQEDVEEIQKDVDEIEKDVDEIEKDIDEIQKDVDVIEKELPDEVVPKVHDKAQLEQIETRLMGLLAHLEKMKEK